MRTEKATPRSCSYNGVKVSTSAGTSRFYHGWTADKCRAIVVSLGGGFALLAALEVLCQW